MQCFLAPSQYSRHRRKRYTNTLMRLHNHSWTWTDILHALHKLLQVFLYTDYPTNEYSATPREFLFFFDSNNNGSTSLFGLNISQRDAAYDAMVKVFEWFGYVITEHFFATYI